jgi:replicative DNA helicase
MEVQNGGERMSVGESLLSKLIDANDIGIITRFHVNESEFPTSGEREAFRFIVKYANDNRNQAPSYATVVGECADFTYIPDVSDSYEYLIRKIKDSAGKRSIAELFNGEVPQLFESHDTESFITELQTRLDTIRMGTNVRNKVGTDIKADTDAFLSEYDSRKAGKSFRIWKSKFPTINRAVGGYYSGNMYTWYARSGRGKSIITMEEAIESAFQGANVLVWALEMMTFAWLARAYTSVSARRGVALATHNGIDLAAGFDNRALHSGKLPEEYELELRTFLAQINDILPGNITVRGVNDADFRDRSLKQLEADILDTKADVVVIDPFYYLRYEANTGRKTGGDAEATSQKLRMITGYLNVVMHVITQADENPKEKDSDGVRELKPPMRSEIKKTSAVLEDAAVTFGIDTLNDDGRGVILLGKGRDGGEDARVELIYLPNYGIVRELNASDEAAQFVGNF